MVFCAIVIAKEIESHRQSGPPFHEKTEDCWAFTRLARTISQPTDKKEIEFTHGPQFAIPQMMRAWGNTRPANW